MLQEIRLHGQINASVEYFSTGSARDIYRSYFYEFQEGGQLRFFSPGNELRIDSEGVSYNGNGGTFCEYMFGVDMPLADLAKEEVRNRLVLYGTTYEEAGRTLRFTRQTKGRMTFERIFFDGNAVCNYLFFISGSFSGPVQTQQEEILRLLGKLLKRSEHVGGADDTPLIQEIFGLLGLRSSLYLVRLINTRHKEYYDAFKRLYHTYRAIPDHEFTALQELADKLEIDGYQQERIRVDIMYKHPENRRIVDEYKNILISCDRKGSINKLENARLTRLKTLSVRNKIPAALFYTLDEMLKNDKQVDLEEDYISETRQILDGIFLHERQIDASIDEQDMTRLLHAKRRASENRDHTFEQILLDTGKTCDEMIRDGADFSLMESLSYIITFFDRYDTTSAHISQLAFMPNSRFNEDMIRSLLGSLRAFEELSTGLFASLFFGDILNNKYISNYGRKKIITLRDGLAAIIADRQTVQQLLQTMRELDAQENLYALLLSHIKERISKFYSLYNSRAEQEALLIEVSEELHNKGLLTEPIPPQVFRDVVVNIKTEAIYLHNLLPQIIAQRDTALREDFLENSGLDRFYVEELEREYFELNELAIDDLYQIRKGLNA
ncbi:MAG: TIGR04442 family protein [Desulfuromonadales bacterium]|nr:TIGR04442 family protein [Desulfuromonadales bacterium]